MTCQDLDNWRQSSANVATLSSITMDGRPVPHFDKRIYNYTVYKTENVSGEIKAVSDIKNARITISSEGGRNGKAKITVSAPDFITSTYVVYTPEKPIRIVKNNANEYSSWDESFANHRIVAPKMKPGTFLEYQLNGSSNIGALTMGLTNQHKKGYAFELWASSDHENWTLAYKGISKKVAYTKNSMPQSYEISAFNAKYVRVKNTDDASDITIEVLCYHKNATAANEYLNHAYKEVLSDVQFLKNAAIEIKKGASRKLEMEGLSNYGNKVSLSEAVATYESEDPNLFSVSKSGEIMGTGIGISFLRIVVQKGDYVFHKKIQIKVLE